MDVWTLTSLRLAPLLVLLGGVLAGCAAKGPPPPRGPAASRAESLQRMDPVRIEADTMGFADRFVGTMSEACDELERGAPTAAGRDAALRVKTDMAIGAISNAVNPRPIAGMMDMVAMVTLLRRIADDPWAAETFGGPGAARLAEALARQQAAIDALAGQYMTDAQLAELGTAVARWHRTHPDEHYVSNLRLLDLPEANRPPEAGGGSPSVFTLLFIDPMAKWAPALREAALMRGAYERTFFFLQRWPMLLRWQAEGAVRLVTATPQFKRVASDISSVAGSTTRFVDVSDRFTDVVARLPQQLSAERHAALRQFSSELTRQREAAIGQFADTVAAQREAAIVQATARVAVQREEAIRQATTSLRGEQQIFVANLEAAMDRSITRLVWRSAGAAAVLLAFWAAAAAVIYRPWHRGQEDHAGSTRPDPRRTTAGRKWPTGDEAGGTT